MVFVASLIGAIFFLSAGINQVIAIVRNFKDKPSAGEVRGESAEKFVTRSDFKEHVAATTKQHENLFSKLGGVERGAKAALDAERVRVDARFNELLRATNEHREHVQHQLNQLLTATARIEGKLGQRHHNSGDDIQ
jgi:hypothetical protein